METADCLHQIFPLHASEDVASEIGNNFNDVRPTTVLKSVLNAMSKRYRTMKSQNMVHGDVFSHVFDNRQVGILTIVRLNPLIDLHHQSLHILDFLLAVVWSTNAAESEVEVGLSQT